MELEKLFPQGHWVKKVKTAEKDDETYAIPLESGFWLLEKSSLTKREQALVALLTKKKEPIFYHPWLNFLKHGGSQPTLTAKAIQFIHLYIHETSLVDVAPLFEMLISFFPNYLTHFQTGRQDYVLLLDQSQFIDVSTSLQDTLMAMEFDFASQLNFLIGTILSTQDSSLWAAIFQLESQLFKQWNHTYKRSSCLRFSHLYLWKGERKAVFSSYLKKRIQAHDGLQEIILALWQEGAVLTKASQQLYIHRNTLQYRLEKFHEATGLSLKNMDDLALCYLTVLSQEF